jgi:hypothetical protein
VGERGSRTNESGVGVAQGLYRPGPMRVPYWDRCDGEAVEGRREDAGAVDAAEQAADVAAADLEVGASAVTTQPGAT